MVLLNNRIIAVIKTKLGKKCYKKDKKIKNRSNTQNIK